VVTRLTQGELFGSAESLPPFAMAVDAMPAPPPIWPSRERRVGPRAPLRRPSLESPLSQMALPGAAEEPTWQQLVRSAKRGPARDAWPVRPWQEHVDRWLKHAETPVFKERLEKALGIAQAGARRGRLLCSLSGGKDSTALAGVLHEAGVPVEGAYARCVLNYPDCEEVLAQLCERLGCTVLVIRPDGLEYHVKRICRRYGTPKPRPTGPGGTFSEWDVLKCFPKSVCLTDDAPYRSLGRAFGCANLLVAFRYTPEGSIFAGAYHGARAAESTRRYMGSKALGAVFKSPQDGSWTCTPIIKWSGKDVMAFIHSRGLPLHPYYRAAYETGLGRADPSKIRVGAITSTELAERGRMVPVARLYPAWWRQIVRVRPELARFAAISPQL
jgi:3'-phosphoadenosine 5'-phosphosulfate sulfotransferase (PAPS reductase)/FAD synthetase